MKFQVLKITYIIGPYGACIALNKKKIINDPVYGFITVPFEIVHDVLGHPWFQRLTRIRQLGLTFLVYPGALHTRFHHTLGAMHLMMSAIDTLRTKGHPVSREEAEAACLAILMHDIGHGPFSHALENLLIGKVPHEFLSGKIMEHFNSVYAGRFAEAIDIFTDKHPKKFLHQLVSSQLDVDRLDYLNRDSFFTGVSEGVISSERIIKMLEISNGNLVVEEKGIYSVEKFIIARRLMYWQVYLHKTVLAAEHMLINIITRAKELAARGEKLFGTPDFLQFLHSDYHAADFTADTGLLEKFARVDDFDVLTSIKVWSRHPDLVLSLLCQGLVDRKLFRIDIGRQPVDPARVEDLRKQTAAHLGITPEDARYFVFTHTIANNAYDPAENKIKILFKSGSVADIAEASDNFNISALTRPVTKYFVCYYRF